MMQLVNLQSISDSINDYEILVSRSQNRAQLVNQLVKQLVISTKSSQLVNQLLIFQQSPPNIYPPQNAP